MKLIKYLYRQSWRMLIIAALAGGVSGLSSAALVVVINKGIQFPEQYVFFGGVFFSLCLVLLLSKLAAELSLLKITQEAIFSLRIELSRRLLATPLKRLQALGKHRLLVILTDDINTFTNAFEFVPLLFINSVVITACLAYLAWLSWQMLAMLAAFLFLGLVVFHFAERRPLAHLAKVREQKDVIYQHFRNLIEGSKELQLNAERGTAYVEQVIAPGSNEFKRWFTKGMAGYAIVANIGTMLFYLNIGILLFVLPIWFRQPAEILSGFTVTLLYLIRPIIDVMTALPTLRQAGFALQKIHQLEGELDESLSGKASSNPFNKDGQLQLELKGVCHQYAGEKDDNPFMLGPLDLQIRQGELIYIVGGNGSGKTTLAMLLLGLYQPEAGQIFLNGKAVNEENIDQYRQHFSAVFADFHLFEHLLSCTRLELSGQAEQYIASLGMAHKVNIVDGRFSTVNLSTGQRKRLALVSAYIEDRPIYLFDEWAADQDPVFKQVFYTRLLPELKAKGKTVLVITHDDAYFSYADRIIKLQDGRLLAQSTNFSVEEAMPPAHNYKQAAA